MILGLILNKYKDTVKDSILSQADTVYWSLDALLSDESKLSYGDILLVANGFDVDDKAKELHSKGILIRNLSNYDKTCIHDNTISYNKMVKKYIKTGKSRKDICKEYNVTLCKLDEYIKNCLYYTDRDLYNEYIAYKESKTKCIPKSNLEVDIEAVLQRYNIDVDIRDVVILADIDGVKVNLLRDIMAKDKTSVYLQILREYVADGNTKSISNLVSGYGITAHSVTTFANRHLKEYDSELYIKYKARTGHNTERHINKTTIDKVVKLVEEYISNTNITLTDLCDKYRTEHRTIHKVVDNWLISNNIDLYNKFKLKLADF